MKKGRATIVDPRYQGGKTIPLLFTFEKSHPSCAKRLQKCQIRREEIEGKELYIFDGLFEEEEGRELREFSDRGAFTTKIYGNYGSEEKGEEPATSLSGAAKWKFFTSPPAAVEALFHLLAFWGEACEAVVSTQPWELYGDEHCYTPTFATNFLRKFSASSEKIDQHRDYDPEKGVIWEIPLLYPSSEKIHPAQFSNGALGRPWLVTAMLYVTSSTFSPHKGLGTYFCNKKGEVILREECRHMRLILFEGDISHGVTQKQGEEEGFRISYVFKLVFNPCKKLSLKQSFRMVLCRLNNL